MWNLVIRLLHGDLGRISVRRFGQIGPNQCQHAIGQPPLGCPTVILDRLADRLGWSSVFASRHVSRFGVVGLPAPRPGREQAAPSFAGSVDPPKIDVGEADDPVAVIGYDEEPHRFRRKALLSGPTGGGRRAATMVMREHEIPIDEIYIPMKRRHTVDPQRVTALAEDILAKGQQNPIWVRRDDARYVLVEGLYRLEACKALGERTIKAVFVQARQF